MEKIQKQCFVQNLRLVSVIKEKSASLHMIQLLMVDLPRSIFIKTQEIKEMKKVILTDVIYLASILLRQLKRMYMVGCGSVQMEETTVSLHMHCHKVTYYKEISQSRKGLQNQQLKKKTNLQLKKKLKKKEQSYHQLD